MICKKCAHESYCGMAQFGGHNPKITACYQFTERHQTNADKIRAMTDEDLAEYLVHKIEGCGFDGYDERVNAWLDWLKQEAKE